MARQGKPMSFYKKCSGQWVWKSVKCSGTRANEDCPGGLLSLCFLCQDVVIRIPTAELEQYGASGRPSTPRLGGESGALHILWIITIICKAQSKHIVIFGLQEKAWKESKDKKESIDKDEPMLPATKKEDTGLEWQTCQLIQQSGSSNFPQAFWCFSGIKRAVHDLDTWLVTSVGDKQPMSVCHCET